VKFNPYIVELAVNCGDNELLTGPEKNATLLEVRAPLGDQFAALLKSVLVGVQVLRTFVVAAGEDIDPRQKRMLTRKKQELIFFFILL